MVRWLSGVDAALGAVDGAVDVFLRDDDAGWADDRLLALLDLLAERGLPVDLAVIPAALRDDLAAELRARPVGLHQHGLAHVNHEAEGRKHEFGPSRSREQQLHDIAEGRRLLDERLDGRVAPIFTPPWNRCTEATAACLVELGFEVLSRESRAEPLGVDGLRELPVHLDYVRLPADALAARLADAVAGGGPVGLMLHHEEMDAAARARAGELFDLLAGHAHVSVQPMMTLAGR
jgi:peptidoglycan/xylan/chitin deacetylase (PgdA/CDA1 family)